MNIGWGAPGIHAELLKLGITISEITVSRYIPERSFGGFAPAMGDLNPRDHPHKTIAIDSAVVPTSTFGIVYVFFVLSLERDSRELRSAA